MKCDVRGKKYKNMMFRCQIIRRDYSNAHQERKKTELVID